MQEATVPGGVFDGYSDKPTAGAAWDEMVEPGGGVRATARLVHRAMAAMSVGRPPLPLGLPGRDLPRPRA